MGQGKRPFASQQALFDLDGAQSIKTMHKANENTSIAQSQDSSKRVRILQGHPSNGRAPADNSESSVVSEEGRGSKRSGHMPKSVGVRVEDNQGMNCSSEGSS